MTDPDVGTRLRNCVAQFEFVDRHNGNVLTLAADEIERLRNERNAFEAERDELVRISNKLKHERDDARRACKAWESNLAEPQEIDPADLQALMDAAWKDDRLTVMLSARDLWRMASDRRGREEE
jgi:FtsZ-binding cell division protein ZapB